MKKALSHLIIGISAASLTQPLKAVENEDELIPTPIPPAKKREFKYTFEVMKMQVSMRIAIKPEDCLVKAVRDQILNVAPYLISSIHNPSDATYLLDRVFRTDSLEDKEIIRQALYTAAGLELTVELPSPTVDEAVVDTPKLLNTTEAAETPKKREFEYVIESMKMQHRRRIAVSLEDSLVDAVSDQLRKVAPSLISNIHSPDDVASSLGREVKTEHSDGYDILKQALYKAAGLELPIPSASAVSPSERVTETQEPIRVESPIDIAPVNVAPNLDNASLEVETTIPHGVSSMDELRILDEGLSSPINVTTPNHTAHSLTQEAIQAPGDPIEMTTHVVTQTEKISEVESREPVHEVSTTSYKGAPETQLKPLKMATSQPHLTQLPKLEHSEKTINFTINLDFVSPGFNITHSSSPQEASGWREETTSSKPSLSLGAKNNLTLLDQEKFADTKIPIKSKARLHTKYDELQLRASSTPSLLNHLGIGYLAGLMMVLMSFMKDAFGLRTRIQIAARPRNHYQVIGLSDLPTWTFNLNNTNTNRTSGLKNLQKKS